jgi:uncharacterized coiled-coil protein SlyX
MIPYDELRKRALHPQGSEDDMFCAKWTVALLDRIADLEEYGADWQKTNDALQAQIQELEKKIEGQEEWIERVSLGSIESAMAADKAEARIQELEDTLVRVTQDSVIPESEPPASQ